MWEVAFINNKTLTKEQGNVVEKPLNLDTKSFPSRRTLCQWDSCGVNFSCISELFIDKKNYLGKKTDEFNACGKLLLSIKHEKTHTREKSEFFKNGKTLSHDEDPIHPEKIQMLEQNFDYNTYQETFLEKAIFSTYKREIAEGNDCECNEYGRTFFDNSFLVHQINPSEENHCGFSGCGKSLCIKSTLLKHHGAHMKHYECNQSGNDFGRNLCLLQLQKPHKGEKHFECNECGKAFWEKSHLT